MSMFSFIFFNVLTELTHPPWLTLSPLPIISPFTPSPVPGNHLSTLWIYEPNFWRFHVCHIMQYLLFSEWFISLNVPQLHPCCHKWQDFLLFLKKMFHCIYLYHIFFIIHPSIDTWVVPISELLWIMLNWT